MKLKNIANISLRAFAAISLGLMAGSCDDLLEPSRRAYILTTISAMKKPLTS